jgi:hypothetical protein
MTSIVLSALKVACVMFGISAILGALTGLAWVRIKRRRKKNGRTSK